MFYDVLSIGANIMALILVLIAIKMLLRSGWVLAWIRGTGGLVVLCLAGLMLLTALDIKAYKQWNEDEPLAKVSFSRLTDQQYEVVVVFSDNAVAKTYKVHGDQWQIEARILRWDGWLNRMGGKPGYRLERLSGRYISAAEDMYYPRSVHSLHKPSEYFDVWHWIYKAGGLPGVRAAYGSATYIPMAHGAFYEVGLSQTGVTAKPLNEQAKAALQTW